MKRAGNIYPYVTHINNLKIAHQRAKRGKSNRKEIKQFEKKYINNLYKIQEMLINKTYESSEYEIITIMDKGKEREIANLPYFPDRVIHWAVMLHIEETFLKHFISSTYAALP